MPYKGFNSDFSCRGKKYEENTTYEENGNSICEHGVMHYCDEPFDVLDYYGFVNENGEISEFAEVTPVGEIYHDGNKSATNKLHIGAKLGLKGFVKACVDFTIEKTSFVTKVVSSEKNIKNDSGDYAKIGSSGNSAQIGSSGNSAQIGSSGNSAQIGSSGNSAKIGSSGDYAQIGSSGDSAQIGSSGDYAQIGSSGDYAQIGSSGNYARIGSSGDYAQIGSSGYSAQIGSSGNSAQIGSSGDYAQIGSSGYYAKIISEGHDSVVMAAGYDSIAKAKKGSWITLAEWDKTESFDKNGNRIYVPVCVKTERVDGEKIKEDTFYKLVSSEFKEVESEE